MFKLLKLSIIISIISIWAIPTLASEQSVLDNYYGLQLEPTQTTRTVRRFNNPPYQYKSTDTKQLPQYYKIAIPMNKTTPTTHETPTTLATTSIEYTEVSEPSILALMGLGILGLGLYSIRRNKRK